MRAFGFLGLTLAVATSTAVADSAPTYRLVEDGALGAALTPDVPVLTAFDVKLAACVSGPDAPTGSALFWVEISRAGKVSDAVVHGAGKVDGCLAKALTKAVIVRKLAAAMILIGHIDLMEPGSSKFMPSPRVSTTPILFDAHDTKWQLSATKIAYTANRMLDITQALDATSAAIADCAPKRGDKTGAAQALVWTDGHPRVRSGTKAYDDCLEKALASIKLPAPESAFWMQLEITPPTEKLAARTDKPAMSHEQAIHDALTTAVRSRKLDLLSCLDGHPKTTLTKLTITLHGLKADTKIVSTGNAEADVCVRKKFHAIAIPSTTARDSAELEVTLDPE